MHRATLTVCAAALLLSLPALAHHGWGSYDASKTLTISAPLIAVHYRNPHAEVTLNYRGKPWNAVLAPINRMSARGLPEQALVVGKTVTIVGYPRLDDSAELRAERITVDGKTIELR